MIVTPRNCWPWFYFEVSNQKYEGEVPQPQSDSYRLHLIQSRRGWSLHEADLSKGLITIYAVRVGVAGRGPKQNIYSKTT